MVRSIWVCILGEMDRHGVGTLAKSFGVSIRSHFVVIYMILYIVSRCRTDHIHTYLREVHSMQLVLYLTISSIGRFSISLLLKERNKANDCCMI